ncbi:ArsR/SmtB family transcription factor [Cuniculiplasma sp. SKW4]|uniref:ArsR/SmtB family transcription factor n=1 Tax=Cuniculiplasma sp. SKW4 TaxID=3400171 RepID=UPI003FCF107A
MDRETERIVWYVLGATRGGPMRFRILRKIMNEPANRHSIANDIGVNYRTVEHHLDILLKNGFVIEEGEGYGKIYFPSQKIEKFFVEIEEMMRRKGLLND